jgi:hypothetical protein
MPGGDCLWNFVEVRGCLREVESRTCRVCTGALKFIWTPVPAISRIGVDGPLFTSGTIFTVPRYWRRGDEHWVLHRGLKTHHCLTSIPISRMSVDVRLSPVIPTAYILDKAFHRAPKFITYVPISRILIDVHVYTTFTTLNMLISVGNTNSQRKH